MAIYLLRHGESEGNVLRINQGRGDLPLTVRGREQAAVAGRWLARQGVLPRAIYASPLRRAVETAEIIATQIAHESPLHAEPDVIEYHAGEAEGLTEEELHARYPDFAARRLDERGCWARFGGESYEDVQERLTRFVSKVTEQVVRQGRPPAPDYGRTVTSAESTHGDIVVVAHGGSMYQLLKLWCGWPAPRHYFTRIGNCTCFKLELREMSGHVGAELQFMVPIELME